MRDRRYTNLSTSSTFSTDSDVSGGSRASLNEKRVFSPSPTGSPLLDSETKEHPIRPARRTSTLLLFLTIIAVLALKFVLVSYLLRLLGISFSTPHSWSLGTPFAGDRDLPDQPSAVKVLDGLGQPKWTVHIPHDYSFPLQSRHAQQICRQSETLRDELSMRSRMMPVKDWRRKGGYYVPDTTFLDVDAAAELSGQTQSNSISDDNVCESSLTFALDTQDTSFGKSLLMLWLSYGLAKKEGRAFFVDDSRWLYGRYTSFFLPLPSTNCTPPPPRQVVPCPHNAKHLLVSSATIPWTFGAAFEREYLQSWKSGLEKSRQVYGLLRTGYEDLFHLTDEHATFAALRSASLKGDAERQDASTIGVHLRRGDLHPFEYQFSQDYLPLERYGAAARKLRAHCDGAQDASPAFAFLLASDDPDIFESAELQQSAHPFAVQKTQERIQLASKATLDLSAPTEDILQPDSGYTKHVDENSGWEGGFYSALFYSIGGGNRASSSSVADDTLFSAPAMQMRELVGRAYLLDLAVLGTASDGIVCASSSATCRVLGVMMGWDAVAQGRWVNVDDNRAWSWDGRR